MELLKMLHFLYMGTTANKKSSARKKYLCFLDVTAVFCAPSPSPAPLVSHLGGQTSVCGDFGLSPAKMAALFAPKPLR